MADVKYKLLASLIESEHDRWGNDVHSWHGVVIDIVNIISVGHGGEDELADAIFARIAAGVVDIDKEEASEDQVDKT